MEQSPSQEEFILISTAAVAQSVMRLTTGWTIDSSEFGFQ
jgi:hypothetical protein